MFRPWFNINLPSDPDHNIMISPYNMGAFKNILSIADVPSELSIKTNLNSLFQNHFDHVPKDLLDIDYIYCLNALRSISWGGKIPVGVPCPKCSFSNHTIIDSEQDLKLQGDPTALIKTDLDGNEIIFRSTNLLYHRELLSCKAPEEFLRVSLFNTMYTVNGVPFDHDRTGFDAWYEVLTSEQLGTLSGAVGKIPQYVINIDFLCMNCGHCDPNMKLNNHVAILKLLLQSGHSLANFYTQTSMMVNEHKYRLEDIHNCLPYEFELYVKMLTEYVKKKNEEHEKNSQTK